MLLNEYDHQVAGHKEEALLGIGGRFILKPLVKKDLFRRESEFYQHVAQSRHDTNSPARFLAEYYGLIYHNINNSAESGLDRSPRLNKNGLLPHIVLEDLTFKYRRPNVIDIKMGTCTFEPTASMKKKESEMRKYPYQSELGFRITGFKIFDKTRNAYLKTGKPFGRSILPREVLGAFGLLFSDGSGHRIRVDVVKAVILQLEGILLWMKGQNRFRFYCSSLLIVYDTCTDCIKENDVEQDSDHFNAWSALSSRLAGDNCPEMLERMRVHCGAKHNTGETSTPVVRVKMIDFAHVVKVDAQQPLVCACDAPASRSSSNSCDTSDSSSTEDCSPKSPVTNMDACASGVTAAVDVCMADQQQMQESVAETKCSCHAEQVRAHGCCLGERDEGYIYGLTSLIHHLRALVEAVQGCETAGMQGEGGPAPTLLEQVAALKQRVKELG